MTPVLMLVLSRRSMEFSDGAIWSACPSSKWSWTTTMLRIFIDNDAIPFSINQRYVSDDTVAFKSGRFFFSRPKPLTLSFSILFAVHLFCVCVCVCVCLYSGVASSKRLRDRQGSLGRIVQCRGHVDSNDTNNNNNHNNNALLYDVEWILGGRLSGLRRDDLRHTTADEEGLTQDSRGHGHYHQRRPRQAPAPASTAVATAAKTNKTTKASKSAAVRPKKKGGALKKTSKKKTTGSRGVVANTKRPAVAKTKRAHNTTQDGAPKGPKNKRKSTEQNGPEAAKKRKADETPAPSVAVMDLYERHRREFERIVSRLEKVDAFGYFWETAPESFDEEYEDEPHMGDNDAHDSMTAESLSETVDAKEHATIPGDENAIHSTENRHPAEHITKTPESVLPTLPVHPPYNWDMVRREMDRGRYVLDREQKAEEDRLKLMGPYYNSLNKKKPRQKKKSSRKEDARGTKVDTRVIHPRGVHWDLFRDDVLSMCDAVIAKDTSEETGVGSIAHSANKLKEVCRLVLSVGSSSFFIISLTFGFLWSTGSQTSV
jgi:hypothetical protein